MSRANERLSREGRSSGRRRVEATLLGVLLVWALALRLFYGLWAVEDRIHPDERLSFRNTGLAAASHELRPATGYYAPATYLPQAGMIALAEALRARGVPGVPRMLEEARLTPAGLRLCRAIQALYGTLLVAAVFVLGRRAFGAPTGLIGAALVALSAYYVVGGGLYKPDALAGLLGTVALLASIDASESGRAGRFVLAGSAVGLALSVKFPAGAVAGPLALSTLMLGRRQPRRWLLLAAAGVAAVAVFLLTHPTWRLGFAAMAEVRHGYAWRARTVGVGGEVAGLAKMLWSLSAPGFGLLVALGFAGLAAAAWRGPARPERRVSHWMLLSALPIFTAVYFSATPHFKAHNFMPVAPVVTLIGAWALVGVGLRLAAGGRRGRLAVAALGAVGLGVLVWQGHAAVYRRVIPTTLNAALAFVRSPAMKPTAPGLAWVEERGGEADPWEGLWQVRAHAVAILGTPDLAAIGGKRLALADGEVFREELLRSAPDGLEAARFERARGRRARLLLPAAFRARGPAMAVIAHPWKLAGTEPLASIGGRQSSSEALARLPPGLEPGEVVSLRLTLAPGADSGPWHPALSVGGRAVRLTAARPGSRHPVLVSERFRVEGAEAPVLGPEATAVRRAARRLELLRWQPRRAPARATSRRGG